MIVIHHLSTEQHSTLERKIEIQAGTEEYLELTYGGVISWYWYRDFSKLWSLSLLQTNFRSSRGESHLTIFRYARQCQARSTKHEIFAKSRWSLGHMDSRQPTLSWRHQTHIPRPPYLAPASIAFRPSISLKHVSLVKTCRRSRRHALTWGILDLFCVKCSGGNILGPSHCPHIFYAFLCNDECH